jgi:hypothetical protein
MKVDLDYDVDTLRITDPGEEAQGTPGTLKPQVGSIMNSIKTRSTSGDDSDTTRKFERAQGTPAWEQPAGSGIGGGAAQNVKLKQMLAGLRKVE